MAEGEAGVSLRARGRVLWVLMAAAVGIPWYAHGFVEGAAPMLMFFVGGAFMALGYDE